MLPFSDTRITQYFAAEATAAAAFVAVFPGVQAANSVEKMCEQVDAVWMGDASGKEDDHLDLVAPGISK